MHLSDRYGPNLFPEPPFAGFWALFFESFQDPILLILIAAACVRCVSACFSPWLVVPRGWRV